MSSVPQGLDPGIRTREIVFEADVSLAKSTEDAAVFRLPADPVRFSREPSYLLAAC